MNEVTRIHLGRQPFTISVDAHKLLKAYLAAIKHQVGAKHADVIEEVEMRMAELLHERGVKGDKVVVAEDIKHLKEQLGEPRDFTDDDKDDEAADEPDATQSKRLFRDPEHGIVAGVAAGLAAYFGVDVTVVRLLFLLLLLFGGSSILLYLVLWLIMPEAKSQGDRLQMHGKAVTVDALKEFAERADVEATAKRAGGAVRQVIEGVFRVALGLVGVAFIVGALLGLLSVVSFGAALVGNQEYVFNGMRLFPVGGREMLVLGLGVVVMIIPLVFALFGGLALIRRKWTLPNWAVASMLSIFFVSASAGVSFGLNVVPKVKQRYENAHYSVTRPLQDFSQLNLIGDDVQMIYEPAATYSMEVRSIGDKDISGVKTTHRSDILVVDSREFTRQNDCNFFCIDTEDPEIIIRAPKLPSVLLADEVDFRLTGDFEQTDFKILASGTASFRLGSLDPQRVKIDVSENGERYLELAGITPGTFEKDGIWADEFVIIIADAEEVELKTAQACDIDTPLLFLHSAPQSLKVNDQVVTRPLLPGNDEDNPRDTNCVRLGFDKPTKAVPPIKESYKPIRVETL